MGYRSQVQCVIYGTKDNMQAYITSQILILGSPVFNNFRGDLRYFKSEFTGKPLYFLHLSGEDWKWHEYYTDVIAWTKFMRESTEMDLDYEFIRVGENDGDIEREKSANAVGFLFLSNPIIENHLDEDTEIPLPF